MKKLSCAAVFALAGIASAGHFRINQNGRILASPYPFTTTVLFNSSLADRIIEGMQILPLTNPWNEDISRRPVLSNSAAMIADIISELDSDKRTLVMFPEMNYAFVPDTQPLQPVQFFNYPEESDPSPYPIPDAQPIESWPVGDGAGQTLSQWQHDVYGVGGDRHSITVMPGKGFSWETWEMNRNPDNSWQASNGAKFNLNSNALRPAGWTSGDAAGFPMFPAVVRYDECMRGMVEHCMRIVVKHSRLGYIYPGNHNASKPATTNPNVPAMGQRVRLKANFVVPPTWTLQERAIAYGLKKFGAMVADNGNYFSISYCPDQRFPSGCFDDLSNVSINNFEVIQTTGPTEGPRSPNPPISNAGNNLTVSLHSKATLAGSVTGGAVPVTILWYKYSGPGAVSFANARAASTAATFSQVGTYYLILKGTDAVHAPALDACTVTVTP